MRVSVREIGRGRVTVRERRERERETVSLCNVCVDFRPVVFLLRFSLQLITWHSEGNISEAIISDSVSQ